MDSRDRKASGRRGGRGGYRGRARSDRGSHGRDFHYVSDRPHGLSADQGTNIGTTGTNGQPGPARITGDGRQIGGVLRMIPAEARLNLSFASPTRDMPSTANKRKPAEGEADLAVNPKRRKVLDDLEAIDTKTCGNCGAENHKAAFCVKTGGSGWIEACPKCDSTKHLYEACPQRKKGEEDFIYLVYNRQRKPPIKSRMKLGKVIKNELARPGTKWHQSHIIELPYSSTFARQEARLNPPEAWKYVHFGDPAQEAKERMPEPSRMNVSLINAAMNTSLAEQAWSPEQERLDPEHDGEMPLFPQFREPNESTLFQFLQPNKSESMRVRDLRDHAPIRKLPERYHGTVERMRRMAADPSNPCDNCGQINHFKEECSGSVANTVSLLKITMFHILSKIALLFATFVLTEVIRWVIAQCTTQLGEDVSNVSMIPFTNHDFTFHPSVSATGAVIPIAKAV
ncbi:hypothetical protein F4679DRAFT_586817 [Xylaria curta]|nr:hypothetical protein F4679DRAFT_586817 [Xylaria curta]